MNLIEKFVMGKNYVKDTFLLKAHGCNVILDKGKFDPDGREVTVIEIRPNAGWSCAGSTKPRTILIRNDQWNEKK